MLVEGLQQGNPKWIGQSSCFYYELQLLVVLCLGTPLRVFYLPWHKKRDKLILSFQTAAELERGRGGSRLYSREVSINGLQTSTTFCQCLYLMCSFTPKTVWVLFFFWFDVFFPLRLPCRSSFRVYHKGKASAQWVGMYLGQCVSGWDKGAQNAAQIPGELQIGILLFLIT